MMPSDEIEQIQINKFVDLKGKKVLEVGCGDGRLTAFLSRKTERLTAIDTDETRILNFFIRENLCLSVAIFISCSWYLSESCLRITRSGHVDASFKMQEL